MSALARQQIRMPVERSASLSISAPAFTDRLRARLHDYALDARLADGERADGDRLLAARAWQLTRRATRARLASALDAVLSELDGESSSRGGASVPVDRREAEIARSELIRLADRLREAAPVAPRGVALVRRLLCDGTSPLYLPGDDELWCALRRAAIALC
jgi:hypothetical protein